MYNQNKLINIIKKCQGQYSLNEFSKISNVDSAYLSRILNKKRTNPPSPKILEKIAKASNGITSYLELMEVCGYIEANNANLFSLYNEWSDIEDLREAEFKKLNLSIEEMDIYSAFSSNIIYCVKNNKPINDAQIDKYLENIPCSSKTKIKKAFYITYNHFKNRQRIDKNINIIKDNTNHTKLFTIPVLGKITAGQPILADEYLERYLPVDPNIYGMTNQEDYFYLKVSGDSMNQRVQDGDYVLIHKQDYAEDGDLIVAIVNSDDEATLKRYKKINDEIVMLEPMSTYPMEPIVINLKETKFQIIGKAIGQFGKF